MKFVLTVHIPDESARPGVDVAQSLRETASVIETQNPLIPGDLEDRLTGEHKAHWETWGYIPLVTAPIIDTFGPNPGPVGEGEFGISLTGNFFKEGMQLYIDGAPINHTDVYSQWSITGGMNKPPTARTCQAVLMYDGIGYAGFQWPFTEAAEEPPAPEELPAPDQPA